MRLAWRACVTVRIGISGWRYPAWRGVFYPRGLPQSQELAYASRVFDTIEINGSFYSLPRPASVQAWHDETPEHFVFSVKGSRFITHMKRLRDPTALSNFFASGLLALRGKLGPILWQLPPAMRFDPERLASFFSALPRDTRRAAALARAHDQRLEGRAYLEAHGRRPLRHALEVRHPSFETPEFVALLREHRVALCVADSAGLFPSFEDVTADFVYVRLHGSQKLYESGYTQAELRRWAHRIEAWSHGRVPDIGRLVAPRDPRPRAAARDVYVYFDNDAKVRAPFDAQNLAALVRGEKVPRAPKGLARAGEPARVDWPNWRPRRARV